MPGGDDEDVDDVEVATPTLTDELDLHTVQPREVADLVDEYVTAAHLAGFSTVRIIHGKGAGTLRRIVHGVLERHPLVRRFELAQQGNWGATVAELAEPAGPAPDAI
jgi:dsDNA-specific endonuclease/ATPase MutS2